MTTEGASRRLIVCADDFGRDVAVNEAVEIAHRDGILSTASLMVAAPAAADAVARARRLPGLKVGLHLVLVDGTAVLRPGDIAALVGPDGRFDDNQARAGFRYFFMPGIRRQLAAEIRAQFEAFSATGLALDHVNAHKHMHLHPTVARLIVEIGRDYDMRAVRLPADRWRHCAVLFPASGTAGLPMRRRSRRCDGGCDEPASRATITSSASPGAAA